MPGRSGTHATEQAKIVADFQALHPWKSAADVVRLFDILHSYEDVGLSPNRYGSSDVRTFDLTQLDMATIEETWMRVGGGIIKGPRPWNMLISILFIKKSRGIPALSTFTVWLNQTYFKDPGRATRFLDWCKDVYSWGKMDHGYVALEDEYSLKNDLGPGRSVGGANLKVALPGIYWANFFGPIYSKWFGDGKFELIETHLKERLTDGGWLLVTRPSVLEYSNPELRLHETGIIHALGREAFFEMEDPLKPTKSPDFSASIYQFKELTTSPGARSPCPGRKLHPAGDRVRRDL
jgi:hypothetical protein